VSEPAKKTIQGCAIEIDENRKVFLGDDGEGGWVFECKNNGAITTVHLSDEAILALFRLYFETLKRQAK